MFSLRICITIPCYIVALSVFLVNCKHFGRLIGPKSHDLRNTSTEDEIWPQVDAGFRSSGGVFVEKVPTYITVFWTSKTSAAGKIDKRVAGLGIEVGNRHYIMRRATWVNLNNDRNDIFNILGDNFKPIPLPDSWQPNFRPTHRPFKSHNLANLDVTEGPVDHREPGRGEIARQFKVVSVKRSLGKSPFGLYSHWVDEFGDPTNEQPTPMRDPWNLADFQNDTLKVEENQRELGKDCYLYSYSKSPTDKDGSAISLKEDERRFVKMFVDDAKTCSFGECDLKLTNKPSRSGVCDGFIDDGAAVLCGPEEKLTFLAMRNKEPGCTDNFKAWHVGYMWPEAMRYMSDKKINPYLLKLDCSVDDCYFVNV